MSIKGSKFQYNTVSESAGGGAITFKAGNLTLENVILNGNIAVREGTMIMATLVQYLNISDSIFVNHTS